MAAPQSSSSNRNFILIGVLLLIVGVGATITFLAPSLKESRAKLEQEKAAQRGIDTDIKVLTTAQAQLQAAVNALQTQKGVDFTQIPLIYPKTEDIPGLYLQLESLMLVARARSLDQASYSVSAPMLNTTENSVQIPVTMSMVGPYLELKDFMTTLETNLRPFTIQSVNMSQTLDKDNGKPSGQFTLNLAGVIRAESLSAAYTAAGVTN